MSIQQCNSQLMIPPCPDWRIEDGLKKLEAGLFNIYHAPIIENRECDTPWYSQYFFDKEHTNFIGIDHDIGSYILSVLKCKGPKHITCIRVIMWTSSGIRRRIIPCKPNKPIMDVLKMNVKVNFKKLQQIKNPKLCEALVSLELKATRSAHFYKFGILYMKPGQTKEEEMFSNCRGSAEYKEFLKHLGKKIPLRDWKGYSAGLDTNNDRTGKYSIVAKYCGCDIMFHVSTMLPYIGNDSQQIERKCHIGNDVVIIVFMDSDCHGSWNPNAISSRFPHVYAVVQPVSLCTSTIGYKVNIAMRSSLNNFGPPLPSPPVFADTNMFRHFILAKLINGEREAIRSAPQFAQNFLSNSINNIFQEFLSLSHSSLSRGHYCKFPPKRKTSSKAPDFPNYDSHNPFLEHAPHLSSKSVPAFHINRKTHVLPIEVMCSQIWHKTMICGTVNNLYIIDLAKEASLELKITRVNVEPRKTNHYKQLLIIESLGILVTLINKVGIVIYDILSIMDHIDGPRELVVEKTKSALFFSIDMYRNVLHLCCAFNREIALYQWKGDIFERTQLIQIPRTPYVIEWHNNDLLVGYENEFAYIELDEDTSVHRTFFTTDSSNSQLIPIDAFLVEGSASEFLICFNQYGIFMDKDGLQTRAIELTWSSVPTSFVYVEPFIIAFSQLNIEVRSLVNGSITQIIEAPTLGSTIRFLTTWNDICYVAVNCPSASASKYMSSIHVLQLNSCIMDSSGSLDLSPVNYQPNSFLGIGCINSYDSARWNAETTLSYSTSRNSVNEVASYNASFEMEFY